ncbi:Neopullulanase [Pseudoalteromonas luteoviolacea B = ATCC 29581]|nr:Neopullulanase [Pseudoalteromonas luteoviolacea B = ATCC 29581]
MVRFTSFLWVIAATAGLFSIDALATNTVHSVAPTSWWVGMENPKLQIMVHGPNAKQPWQIVTKGNEKSETGIVLQSIEFTENNNYAFLNVQIEKDARPSSLTFESEDGTLRFEYVFDGREANSRFRQGFTAKDTIYLITPDRFANGNDRNDAHPSMLERPDPVYRGGRHGGDIQGVIDHLAYLSDLGITQLWLSPVLENNMAHYSYHGYSITDLYKVDPRMGDNALYKKLAIEAKRYGIGLIMDMVPNHIGSEHVWMKDMPSLDWINYRGEFVGTSHARQTVQDVHASEYDKRRFVDGWFVPTMPDLNQRNPFLATYLTQNAIWWIEYANLSGFRIDTFPYSDKVFLANWLRAIFAEYPDFNVVGEEWTTQTAIAAYWQKGQNNKDGYESHLPALMDFSLQEALVEALNEEESWNTGWVKVYQSIANDFLFKDPNQLLVFGDNHDMSRLHTQLKQNVEHTKLAMTLLLTTRGIPQIYYGTEILLDNGDSNDHGDIRIDFPGGFKHHVADAKTGQGLSAEQLAMQQYIKQLLSLRKRYPQLSGDWLLHFSPFDGIYAYARNIKHDATNKPILVLLNKSSKARTIDSERFNEVIGEQKEATDLLSGKKHDFERLVVPAKSALVLSL